MLDQNHQDLEVFEIGSIKTEEIILPYINRAVEIIKEILNPLRGNDFLNIKERLCAHLATSVYFHLIKDGISIERKENFAASKESLGIYFLIQVIKNHLQD